MKEDVVCFYNSTINNGSAMSGGDQVFIQIFKRIRGDLGEVWCITGQVGKNIIEREIPRVKFITSPFLFDQIGLMGGYILRTFFALRCLLLKPVLIYSSSDYFPDVIPAFILKLFRPKVKWVQCIFHIYPDWRQRKGSRIRNFVGQYLQKFSLRLARRADVVININQEVKDHLVAQGFLAERIVINPPGIDLEALSRIPSALPDEGYDGIFLGRLHINKGSLDLIEIWKHVVKELPHARLGIIGGGDERMVADLMSRISLYGMERNIDVLGYLENDRAFALLKASKTFLFPSREEGFGIALVEAMQCGLPVVGWKLPVYAEHFSGAVDTIDTGDYGAFASKVVYYIRDLQGHAERVLKGRQCAEKFTWDMTAKKFYACIIEAS